MLPVFFEKYRAQYLPGGNAFVSLGSDAIENLLAAMSLFCL